MFKSSGHAKHTTRMPSVLTLLQIQNVQIRKLPHNLQLLTYYSMVNQLQNSHFLDLMVSSISHTFQMAPS